MEIVTDKYKVIQIATPCLSQFAYYIESEKEAVIIDPLRDISTYLEILDKNHAKLKYIIETHFHADFVSGHFKLQSKTKAEIILGPNSSASFPHKQVYDEEEIKIGRIKLKFLHTPGHTLESICVILMNDNKEEVVFTGDTLFIGDCGRPDLAVNKEQHIDQRYLAEHLFESLQELKKIDDACIVFPAHGAGSPCGKNLSKATFSTMGAQKKENYALNINDINKFFLEVTSNLDAPPQYFFNSVYLNQHNEVLLQDEEYISNKLKFINLDEFKSSFMTLDDYQILDTRNTEDFKKGFIPGSINVPLNFRFAIFAATLLDPEKKIIVVCDQNTEKEILVRLLRTGVNMVEGFLNGGFNEWVLNKNTIDSVIDLDPQDLFIDYKNNSLNGKILDIRNQNEIQNGIVEGSLCIDLSSLNSKSINSLEKNQKYFVTCAGGIRSVMGYGILKNKGYNVINIKNGFSGIAKLGFKIVKPLLK